MQKIMDGCVPDMGRDEQVVSEKLEDTSLAAIAAELEPVADAGPQEPQLNAASAGLIAPAPPEHIAIASTPDIGSHLAPLAMGEVEPPQATVEIPAFETIGYDPVRPPSSNELNSSDDPHKDPDERPTEPLPPIIIEPIEPKEFYTSQFEDKNGPAAAGGGQSPPEDGEPPTGGDGDGEGDDDGEDKNDSEDESTTERGVIERSQPEPARSESPNDDLSPDEDGETAEHKSLSERKAALDKVYQQYFKLPVERLERGAEAASITNFLGDVQVSADKPPMLAYWLHVDLPEGPNNPEAANEFVVQLIPPPPEADLNQRLALEQAQLARGEALVRAQGLSEDYRPCVEGIVAWGQQDNHIITRFEDAQRVEQMGETSLQRVSSATLRHARDTIVAMAEQGIMPSRRMLKDTLCDGGAKFHFLNPRPIPSDLRNAPDVRQQVARRAFDDLGNSLLTMALINDDTEAYGAIFHELDQLSAEMDEG